MVNQRGISVERRKDICTEGQRTESGGNPVVSRCTGSRTWRTMKDGGVGYEKLLVARDNKRCGEVCRRM